MLKNGDNGFQFSDTEENIRYYLPTPEIKGENADPLLRGRGDY